ncbi:MAG TPA: motility protein A [Candidatus Hydrogenedentes bacterium]|nr:motility protein A [Candidatus Hydrogenedentota bacterium]HOL78031.1 motility protein A [Candidatus Hydrogenedentota bacterium]HPO84610.1 motility protein A [Candidatus Hydrogenedentota bacterium]
MDITTIIGLVAGFGLVISAILMGGSPGIFWNMPSVLITVGGMFAATLLNFPLRDVVTVLGSVRNAFLHKERSPEELIEKLVNFATIARREGILALEAHASETDDEFLRKSIQLAIDGTAPELIKDILSTELAFMEDRHAMGQSILIAMGTYAPAFGMIGTLIGLIQMLATLDDPSKIGAGMAVAMITTLYGSLVANAFCLPAAGKLKVRTSNELLAKELIIEGILSIQSGDNPRIVEQKLKAFVSPAVRERIKTGH